MIRINHPKNLRVVLAVALISGSLMVVSCNSKSKSDKKETDTTKVVPADTMPKEDTNMLGDTTKKKDTTKGEQTPPPK
jgi:hypothetical protein